MKKLIHFRALAAGRLAVALFLTNAASALADVHYVDVNSTNATPPYTNWTTAATNIQDAVDAAVAGDEIVVTNGIYSPVVVDKSLNVRSVNGPDVTTIDGGGLVRCAYLTNGTSLLGFTLFDGYAYYGGGAYGGTLSNCTLTLNSATVTDNQENGHPHAYGGGAAYCVLNNCALSYNSASALVGGAYGVATAEGGGAYGCTLSNCTLSGNSASSGGNGYHATVYVNGGGVANCSLKNCTLAENRTAVPYQYISTIWMARENGGGAYNCRLESCLLISNLATPIYDGSSSFFAYGGGAAGGSLYNCTLIDNTADFGSGEANSALNNCIVCFNNYGGTIYLGLLNNCWTTDPHFVNTNGWADLRLRPNSSCINAGNNSYVANTTDLDGNPRIVGGAVDIGAYEFQAPVSMISCAWLQQFGLPINSSIDTADPDGDAVDNYHEWLAGTNPTNSLSSPAQLSITPSGVPPSGIVLTWSTNAVGFALQSTTNLFSPSAWVTNSPEPIVTNGHNTVTNPITGPQQFYRLVH